MTEARAWIRYTVTSQQAAARLIASYSTSFSVATRLLGTRHRHHIRNIYAMVRVADEIVDGIASELGMDEATAQQTLDEYERACRSAMRTGFCTDPVLHAFAYTARAAQIQPELVTAFFDSMRTDLQAHRERPTGHTHTFDSDAHARYVYGSAEVVGLMCLAVFVRGEQHSPAQRQTLEHGARQLGAAFQNVNFLRDLSDDATRLGRSYLSASGRLTEADKNRWVETVHTQLSAAELTIALLPRDARAAVRNALALFAALNERIARTPIDQLYQQRVRVADPHKAALTARALLTTWKDTDS